MSFVQFVIVVLVDVFMTLILRRKLYSLTSGTFAVLVLHLFSLLMGVFYIVLLKGSKLVYVDVGVGDDFYRDLMVSNVLIFVMVIFHGWAISVRYGGSPIRWHRK